MKGLFDQEPAAAMYRPPAPTGRRQNLFEPAPVRRVKRKAIKRKLREITGFPDVPFGRHESRAREDEMLHGGLSPQDKRLLEEFQNRRPPPTIFEFLEEVKSRMSRKEKKEYMQELDAADELVNRILMSHHNLQTVQNNTFDYNANRDFFEALGVENNQKDLLKFFHELIEEQTRELDQIIKIIFNDRRIPFTPLPSIKFRRGGKKCCTCDQKRGGMYRVSEGFKDEAQGRFGSQAGPLVQALERGSVLGAMGQEVLDRDAAEQRAETARRRAAQRAAERAANPPSRSHLRRQVNPVHRAVQELPDVPVGRPSTAAFSPAESDRAFFPRLHPSSLAPVLGCIQSAGTAACGAVRAATGVQ